MGLESSVGFEGVVTSVGASFAIVNHDCYVPRHFVNLLRLQVGQVLHVVAAPHLSGRNKWRAKQITPIVRPNLQPNINPMLTMFPQLPFIPSHPSSANMPEDPGMEDSKPQVIVGEVTSSGQGFCIVNNDIFVPASLFQGKFSFEKGMLVQVEAFPRISGRNKWRASRIEPAPSEGTKESEESHDGTASVDPAQAQRVNSHPSPNNDGPLLNQEKFSVPGSGAREGFRNIVGVVTSQGREFCIVNHDVYVPAYLLGGVRRVVEGHTILRLTVCALRAGRNKWRALEACEVADGPPGFYPGWDGTLAGPTVLPHSVAIAAAAQHSAGMGGMGLGAMPGMGLPPMPEGPERQYEVLGSVTSCGTGFCIVNHDVYVPSHLLGGASVGAGTAMRVRVVERHIGRNNWRALSAQVQA